MRTLLLVRGAFTCFHIHTIFQVSRVVLIPFGRKDVIALIIIALRYLFHLFRFSTAENCGRKDKAVEKL